MKSPIILLMIPALAAAGPYGPAAGQPGSEAIAAGDSAFVMWAEEIVLQRGPVDLTVPDGARPQYGASSSALGVADADSNPLPYDPNEDPAFYPVVSLGDGGTATLTFPRPLADHSGPDFAVFENAFSDTFLELAFVEVSSDGTHFARFPASSLTATDVQISSFGTLDPSNLHNLAGKYRAGHGTPFDLSEIRDSKVNLAAVTHVRVTDVVGSISAEQGSLDAAGNLVNDPFPTPFSAGGFDLDAVGALHAAPISYESWAAWYLGDESAAFHRDSDRDQIPNRLEWSLWRNPLKADSPFTLQRDGSTVRICLRTHLSRLPGTLRLAGSADLTNWTGVAQTAGSQWEAAAPGVIVTTTAGHPDTIRIEVTGTAFRYFRVESEG